MNKIVLVTGATGGIGRHYSEEMLASGYDVVLTYRNETLATTLKDELQTKYPDASIEIMKLDLSSIDEMKSFSKSFCARYNRLDVLVHNAGVYFFDNEKRVSKDDIELNMAIHVVAPYVLTGLLMPVLESTPGSKVISMSSTEHKGATLNVKDLALKETFESLGNMKSYSTSKFAVLVFTAELDRRLRIHKKEIVALAAHPGVSITGIQHKGNPNGVQKFMIGLMGKVLAGKPRDAAQPLILATKQGVGGEYYGPTGFKEAKGKAGLVQPDSNTQEQSLGHDLWVELEKLTGIQYL